MLEQIEKERRILQGQRVQAGETGSQVLEERATDALEEQLERKEAQILAAGAEMFSS